MSEEMRTKLVATALEWQKRYGVAPAITCALSEYDAAQLMGCTLEEYSACMEGQTAVRRGHDFIYGGQRYQVKANRPSGRRGSPVTLVAKPKNYDWDRLIWILYTTEYQIQEAWLWELDAFKAAFELTVRLSPSHMRSEGGKRLWPRAQQAVPADAAAPRG